MAFITTPNPTLGTPQTINLTRSALMSDLQLAHGSGGYFTTTSDYSKWKAVVVVLQSSVGNQQKTLIFDGQSDSSAELDLSLSARQVQWSALSATVYDFDGGHIKIVRRDNASLLSAYDFNLTPAPPVSGYPFLETMNDGTNFGVYQFAGINGGTANATPSGGTLNLLAGGNQKAYYSFVSHLSGAGTLLPTDNVELVVSISSVSAGQNFTATIWNQAKTQSVDIGSVWSIAGDNTFGPVSIAALSDVGEIEYHCTTDTFGSINLNIDTVSVSKL